MDWQPFPPPADYWENKMGDNDDQKPDEPQDKRPKIMLSKQVADFIRQLAMGDPEEKEDPIPEMIQWLKRHDGETLKWGEDSVMYAGVHGGYIDVTVDAMAEDLKHNWCWTIEGPDWRDFLWEDDDPDEIEANRPGWCFIVPYNMRQVIIFKGKMMEEDWSCAFPADGAMTEDQALRVAEAEKDDDLYVQKRGAWTSAALSDALSEWCYQIAGVSIRFEFDREVKSPMLKKVEETHRRVEAGEEEMISYDDLIKEIEGGDADSADREGPEGS